MLTTSTLVQPGRGRKLIGRLRIQLLGVVLAAYFLPLLAPLVTFGTFSTNLAGTWNSQVASLIAAVAALFAFRRVTMYPGTRGFAYMLPAFSTSFGLATAVLLILRLPYSGSMLITGYVASTAMTFLLWFLGQRGEQVRMYYVPAGNTGIVADTPKVEWMRLVEPVVPVEQGAAIVADLRWTHDPDWERMLAAAAISGRTVYHTKQLRESLTGRVQIEHLSENSFGSLLPNLGYRGVKRAIDVAASLILLPVLLLPLLFVALLIRLDSAGPALFRQERMGYQGRPFRVLKFRTMAMHDPSNDARTAAITRFDDDRITKLGRFLRRSRIDELPQIINVLRGEMSWIGPRPEALLLSQWYERELPFYAYRHIVRPGITGWAQVNQGHVAELDDVHVKLHYDFYYIKYFSAWLDMLIVLRTIATMVTGFGAR